MSAVAGATLNADVWRAEVECFVESCILVIAWPSNGDVGVSAHEAGRGFVELVSFSEQAKMSEITESHVS